MSRQPLSWGHLSISGISQLLLTRCWPNFKGMFLEPFFNRLQPLWGYLSSQHLSWQHLSISGISHLLLSQFWPNFKGRSQTIFWLKFLEPNLYIKNCWTQIFWITIFFGSKSFLDPKIFGPNFLLTFFFENIFFGPQLFWT